MDKKRILIAEDYAFTQKLIQTILEKNGYEVVGIANNGREAIRLYHNLKPDLITMDMNMPEMNGLQAIEKIISMDPEAKIIALTGYNKIEVKTRKLGAKGFVSKPFEEKDLVGEVEKLLFQEVTFSTEDDLNDTSDDISKIKEETYENNNSFEYEKEKEVVESKSEDTYDFASIWNINEDSYLNPCPDILPGVDSEVTEHETPTEDIIPEIFTNIFSEENVEAEGPEIGTFADKKPSDVSTVVIYEDDEDDLLGGGVREAAVTVTTAPLYTSEHISEVEKGEEIPEETYQKAGVDKDPVDEYPYCETYTPVYEPEVQVIKEEEMGEEEEMDDDDSFELPALSIDERLQKLSAYERGEIKSGEDVGEEAPGRANISDIDIFSQNHDDRTAPLVVRPPMEVQKKKEQRLEQKHATNSNEVSWDNYMTLEDETKEKKGLFEKLFSKSRKKK